MLPDAASVVMHGSIEVSMGFPVATHWCDSGEAVLSNVGSMNIRGSTEIPKAPRRWPNDFV